MKKIFVFALAFLSIKNYAQDDRRTITTGVPFLLIAADARAAALGDMGVATSSDVFSQQWNPAKYAFAIDKQGFSASYTPYLAELVNDISLAQVTYYNRINERSAFAGSLRYFGLGDITLTNEWGEMQGSANPNEFAIDASYALKLSDRFSMSVAGRYIRSQLKIPDAIGDASAANSFAVDVSGFYQSEEIAFENFNGRWRAGFNFQNLGPKISYDNDANELSPNFLPANMRLGGGFDFILDEFNKVTVTAEITKLLVPTPPAIVDVNGDGIINNSDRDQLRNEYRSIGWVSGIFKSFNDAPDGFSEELKEITYALSGEYVYQDSFALRAGYFNETEEKGARKFFSLGAGFKYNVIKIDVSYLFSASKVRNPLENTLRFSLTFNFGDKYQEL